MSQQRKRDSRPHSSWRGVRLRWTDRGADPDAPTRAVCLPAAWDDEAAAAIAAIAPGSAAVSLPQLASGWIDPIAAQAHRSGLSLDLADRLHRLLISRRGAPSQAVWSGHPSEAPAFVLNLPAFMESGLFDAPGFAEAIETAVLALRLAAPGSDSLRIGMTDLAGLLASCGVAYDSDAGRQIGAMLAAILRGHADAASARMASHATSGEQADHADTASSDPSSGSLFDVESLDAARGVRRLDEATAIGGACDVETTSHVASNDGRPGGGTPSEAVLAGPWYTPASADPNQVPSSTDAVAGLDEAVRRARDAAARSALPGRHHVITTILPTDTPDALLGVETGGIAPHFSPIAADGRLSRSARAFLAAIGRTAEQALAMALTGESVFPPASVEAHGAMHDATGRHVAARLCIPAPGCQLPWPARYRRSRHRGG